MDSDITKLTLENGLLVLLKEIHTAPLISHWVWYRVGSKDEVPGITGISHWVEHMQFKGTPKFPSGVLDKAISRYGGVWNAFTYMDWTTYLETLPADKIDLALELEADRMINGLYPPGEVESERTVIISERQGSENEPLFRLGEEIRAAAFHIHAYHHNIIGDMADLKSITREQLYKHYRDHYSPGNAVLTMAGDFETAPMLERIQQVYGSIPSSDSLPRRVRPEPPQSGERRVQVEGPGETAYIQFAYHAPEATHPDFLSLMVLDSLLTGPQSLNMFGGGLSNKTSRLYRALVEKELAVAVFGGAQATIDPFLGGITAVVHPNSSSEAVLDALDVEIQRLLETPPEPDELSRAVKQARALFAYGSESITNQAYWLGFAEMFDTYEWFTGYLDRLAQVTPQDVLRVAQTYLRRNNRILGIYIPSGNGDESL